MDMFLSLYEIFFLERMGILIMGVIFPITISLPLALVPTLMIPSSSRYLSGITGLITYLIN